MEEARAQQEQQQQLYVPAKTLDTPYPLIDSDPHIRRVYSYARPVDWVVAAGMTVTGPSLQWIWERVHPANPGKQAFAKIMRMNWAIGITAGLLSIGQRSSYRFYGFTENVREQERDMREMVDKVKKGEPLYGVSSLTPHMQGVAARNSRYTGTFLYVIPWFNFVNHQQHGIDTAKYYQQAERELEAERGAKA